MVQEYFQNMLIADWDGNITKLTRRKFLKINEEDWRRMNEPFTMDEIKDALFSMSPYKAARLNGYHAGFYKKAWDSVGDSLYSQTMDYLGSGSMKKGVNDIMVTLVPKVSNPTTVVQFRPISLCNVCYKVITKALTNKIKPIMRELIRREQSSFVPGRQITDNVIIYQEVLHSMRKKKRKKGIMVLKVDLEKAYDRLSWSFIQDTLEDIGFCEEWMRNVMGCITTANLAVLWNGE